MSIRETVTKLYEALVGRHNGHDAELESALAIKQVAAVDRRHASQHVRRAMKETVEVFAMPVEEIGRLLVPPVERHHDR